MTTTSTATPPTIADETQNTITNFSVFTTYKNDVLNPKFAKDIGNIIKALQAGYNPDQWDQVLNALESHLIAENNPHQVSAGQLNIDPVYLMDQLYNDYIQSTTSPVARSDFNNIIFAQVEVANSTTDASQYPFIITANLINQLYQAHNTSINVHESITDLFLTYQTPTPNFLIDTTIGPFDIFSIVGNRIEFITQQTVDNDPPAVYATSLDLSTYTVPTQGSILVHLSTDPNNQDEVDFVILSNSDNSSSLHIYKPAGQNFIQADLTLNNVLTQQKSPAITGDFYVHITYQSSGFGVIFYAPDATLNSVLLSGFVYNMNTLQLFTEISDSLSIDCIHSFAIYPSILTSEQTAVIINP